MNNYLLFQIVLIWAFISTAAFGLIIYWNPYALRIALAKRLVWVCYADGSLEPVKATLDGVAYKTKENGMFEFEREDVVIHAKKPGIIVYAPYSKALRPNVVPTLKMLKDSGIDRYDMLMGVLGSQLMSESDFQKLQKTTEGNNGNSSAKSE
ncbi:MAG: hypothetical protein KAW93_06405 [Methanogenium sp.]|nr:hypothetical protein [Methanogenium sp.]